MAWWWRPKWQAQEWWYEDQWSGAEHNRWKRQCATHRLHRQWAKAHEEARVTGILVTPPMAVKRARKKMGTMS
eukprot:1854389-Karenia_brevis.AAC.1